MKVEETGNRRKRWKRKEEKKDIGKERGRRGRGGEQGKRRGEGKGRRRR